MNTDEQNFVLRARREKHDALIERGIAPYAYGFKRTHTAAAALAALGDAEEGESVRVAGRIVAWRGQGKTSFAHLADDSGRIQLYFRKDELGDEAFETLKLFDIGDVVGVSGVLFRTKTGETTVRVASAEMLAKSLRPLPFGKEETVDGVVVRHSGFSDPEQRYRQRAVDLAVHPEVRASFVARSKMISALRAFLDTRGFLEVETPVLQPLYGGAAARPFTTHHNALDIPLYLRIADELYLKRLIVGGFDAVYEIGHDFRNEGVDRTTPSSRCSSGIRRTRTTPTRCSSSSSCCSPPRMPCARIRRSLPWCRRSSRHFRASNGSRRSTTRWMRMCSRCRTPICGAPP
jgi:lysyl-tRNA synthetase class 2